MAATIPSTECTPIARTGTADRAAPAWGSVLASDAVGINARIEPRSSGPRLSYVGIGPASVGTGVGNPRSLGGRPKIARRAQLTTVSRRQTQFATTRPGSGTRDKRWDPKAMKSVDRIAEDTTALTDGNDLAQCSPLSLYFCPASVAILVISARLKGNARASQP